MDESVARDLRLENMFVVNFDNLPPDMRTGEVLYQNIIIQLIARTLSPDIQLPLREHLVVFEPKVFPAVYHWTTFPISCLLVELFEDFSQFLRERNIIPPTQIELVALLERCLAYAYTGSGKVLMMSLMDQLLISRGLLWDSLPVFHPHIFHFALVESGAVRIKAESWPCRGAEREPIMVSLRAVQLTWGSSPAAELLLS
ncbi:uncharacterized protein B0H18DRAFT_963080 [Fomitopsis serialis]|uniref:uncharacterized protein n=1 Tax=Fomitopsis serialis TaxID=139415 RepID=UPI002008631A|nr:uncharacterized protein B0H18DRAFT_963080 [Neoantrodia serialis]KAH9910611.1 hypothetical protein B0H18DRAFT_963080 [Neoantrodia serialis]